MGRSSPPTVPPPLRPVQSLPEPLVFAAAGSALASACVVAVGNFDGVHLGHAAIARRLRAAADRLGLPAVAFTFDPHPASVLRPELAPTPLTTPQRRAELLLALGVDAVLVQPADLRLMALEAEAFYKDVLRGRLGARGMVEGADFRFGARRAGDVGLLQALCGRDGVGLEIVPPIAAGGEPVSSSRLRGLIAAGRVAEANALATAAYRITGTVVHGAKRGAAIGFPTANLGGVATLLPALGVYAGRATIADEPGTTRPAAVHVGPNATFGETAVSIEAHLVGFAGDLYGRTLHVDFLERVRDTRRFASVDDLKAQLSADVAAAASIAGRPGSDPDRTT